MPSKPPEGEPVPQDGSLPPAALTEVGEHAFGAYVHVPYCATRCGYCDFNTYTAAELGDGVSLSTYVDTVAAEVALARVVLGDVGRQVETVFVGGGTPTLLPPDDLGEILRIIDTAFGLAPEAEVTVEANPESVDAGSLAKLRAVGYTRVSFGMQSARRHVLAALDRKHTPGRVAQVVRWAREAGFTQVSLDLIYGSPGESDADWAASLAAATELEPDHVSAYALTVEEGTKLARKVRRGEVLPADDDLLAARYAQADEAFATAGLTCYEISNWARTPASRCRHNLGYWRCDNWWGFGPGAHSHIGGVRWWNVRHPSDYAARLAAGNSPGEGREVLGEQARRMERVMLGARLAEGLSIGLLSDEGLSVARRLAGDGLVVADDLERGRVRLTRRGRLLADTVVHALLAS
jgi:oxygen-independent coproporphyrinogen-3 oxidase